MVYLVCGVYLVCLVLGCAAGGTGETRVTGERGWTGGTGERSGTRWFILFVLFVSLTERGTKETRRTK